MHLIGLDLNSTRARAVQGVADRSAGAVGFDGDAGLPLMVSYGQRHPTVGVDGVNRIRKTPHLVCHNFLPYLGGDRQWVGGRHSLDPSQATSLVLGRIASEITRVDGVVSSVPDYLEGYQVEELERIAQQHRWNMLGTVPVALAAALAAQPQIPWPGVLLVVDIDSYALSCSAVNVSPTQSIVLATRCNERLSLGQWIGKLLDGVAHRCVRISRRDPRQSAEADQVLFGQIYKLLESPQDEPLVELSLQTSQWSQHLMLRAEELAGFCSSLLQHSAALVQSVLTEASDEGPLVGVVLTHSARSLPGLVDVLEKSLQRLEPVAPPLQEEDFGESLMMSEAMTPSVYPLEGDALSQSAHGLAYRMANGECGTGHLTAAPALAMGIVDPGPARLHFRGKDHYLSEDLFTMGRSPDCSLVFETELYPTVSARHCEVFLDQRAYMLRDRSRYGTLINERPVQKQASLRSGDRIRLGPMGPVIQFLGR